MDDALMSGCRRWVVEADRQRLSSAMTPIHKFVLPTLIPGFLVVLLLDALSNADVAKAGMLGWLLLTSGLLVVPNAVRLKRVEMDTEYLYIRGLGREAEVRLDEVVRVHERWFWSPGIVRVDFRQPTPFGTSVYFHARGVGLFGPSEATEDLRARTGLL